VGTLVGIWALRRPWLLDGPETLFLRRALALQLTLAVVIFIALYVVAGQEVTSDVPGYYMPDARAVIAGQVPGKDFAQSYAPLFPYIGAVLLSVWNSGKIYALAAIAFNAIALAFWHATARATYDLAVARRATILYASSGPALLQVLLGTQQVWIAAALAASACLLIRGRSFASGGAQALAAAITKVLAGLFWPVLWICAPGRLRWLAAVVLLDGMVYGAFALAGAHPLQALQREGDLHTSGNLPYLLEPLWATSARSHLLSDSVAAAVLLCALTWLYLQARLLPSQRRSQLVLSGLSFIGLLFMLVSKKSPPAYAVFFLYPAIVMCVLGLRSLRVQSWFLFGFNLLLVLEPALWVRVGNWRSLSDWLALARGTGAGFIAVELMLLAGYGLLAWQSAVHILKVRAAPERSMPELSIHAA